MSDMGRTRRRVLGSMAGLGIAGVSGCLRTIRGNDNSDGIQSATFRFERANERVRIVYEGGGSLVAQQLEVRSSDGTVSTWNQLGSTRVQADATISEGDTALVGPSVVNWERELRAGTTITLVYMVDESSPTTLSSFDVGSSSSSSTPPNADERTTQSTATGNDERTTQSTADVAFDISRTAQKGLAIDGTSVYVVTDGEVQVVDATSDTITNRFPVPENSRPTGLAYGDGSLWFADAIGPDYNGRTVELDPETGEVRSKIDTSWDPRGLAFGGGSLWVVDITANRIVEFSPDGTQRSSFRTSGITWGQGLAYADGSLWIGTNCNDDGCSVWLYEFSEEGTLKQRVGQRSGQSGSAYGGLAATENKLLGPGEDGTVTVLRSL